VRVKKRLRTRRWGPDARPWQEKAREGVLGTVSDAAQALNLPETWVYSNWRNLPGSRKIGRYVRFDLVVLLENRGQPNKNSQGK